MTSWWILLTLLLLGLPGPAAAGQEVQSRIVPRFDHVVVVIEENKAFHQIIGSRHAPTINQLAREGALMEQSHGVTHPSLPNYLALFSGSTHGVRDDGCGYALTGPNLAEALSHAGLTFAIYSQTMPTTGFKGCSLGAYHKKHNPVAYFASLPAGINRTFRDFPADFSRLPTVAFVIPDQLNDMHDGSIAQGDAWLRKNVVPYVTWARSHRSLLVLTWDEDDFIHGNHIATLLVGAEVRPGRYAEPIDHYDVLRTLADLYGIPAPGHAAKAGPITGIWEVARAGGDAKAR